MNLFSGITSKDGLAIYKRHHLSAVLLEALADGNFCPVNELFSRISPWIGIEVKWNATMVDVNDATTYLIFIKMLTVNEENALQITQNGITALQDCRFQQLSATAFFNYRGMKNNETLIIFTMFSVVISLVALVISTYG